MEQGGREELENLLADSEAAASLARLDGADRERLAGLLQTARREQGRMIAEASEEALSHVPALLRPAVRKLLLK